MGEGGTNIQPITGGRKEDWATAWTLCALRETCMQSCGLWGAKLGSDMIRLAFQSVSLSWNLQIFKFMKYFRRPASHTMSTHIPTSELEKYITDKVLGVPFLLLSSA
ncbi:unnamed protein product [Rangifer tarandus platyrhynchus]|uniref:Uncharacterized protein n=2 Tax=Rangifer tarandus platyrhynchus TaxID=3082113 RepID=A0AC59YYN5_RANTA|nr:unnamed protein product [Rangifer tarandus platyrhynchus]